MPENPKVIDFNKRKTEIINSKKAVEEMKTYGRILKRIDHLIKKPTEEKE